MQEASTCTTRLHSASPQQNSCHDKMFHHWWMLFVFSHDVKHSTEWGICTFAANWSRWQLHPCPSPPTSEICRDQDQFSCFYSHRRNQRVVRPLNMSHAVIYCCLPIPCGFQQLISCGNTLCFCFLPSSQRRQVSPPCGPVLLGNSFIVSFTLYVCLTSLVHALLPL